MAAKPLDPQIVEAVVTDWRLGQLSQQQIATKHNISKGAVNALCKGVERDVTAIVTAGIKYQQALHAQDDRIVTAVEKVVNEAASRMEWLNKAAMKNVSDAMKADCSNQLEYRARADTILKGKEAVFGKTPETVINNTNAQQNNTKLSYSGLSEEELVDLQRLLQKAEASL